MFIEELLGLACIAFWVWILVDCVTRERQPNDRLVWSLVILLAPGIGALIYYFVRRPNRQKLDQ